MLKCPSASWAWKVMVSPMHAGVLYCDRRIHSAALPFLTAQTYPVIQRRYVYAKTGQIVMWKGDLIMI